MRIALACPYSWDRPGGVQVHVAALARELRRRGHEVVVLAPGSAAPHEPWVRIMGRPVAVRYQGTVAPISPWPGALGRIGRELRSFHPDVVHAHEPLTPSTAMYATLRAPAPVVATFHAFAERSALYSAAVPALRPVWRRLRIRVAVSEAAAAFVESRFGDGVRVVPNGVDLDAAGRAEPAEDLPAGRRILWVSRLDPQKGFPVAVRAFAEVAADHPGAVLIVVGDGADRGAIAGLPDGLRDRVVMVGTVPHDRLAAYLAAADVFCSAAVGQESFGMNLVEAMAAGVAVVATDIAGYREVVRDGVEGLLVPPNDPHALAAALGRVLDDDALAERLGAAGQARAEEFAWPAVASRLEAIYEEATAARP